MSDRTWVVCKSADVESLRAQLQAAEQENERLKVEGWCDACCGTGKPASGVECMCAGTGLASMAVTYLRERLLKAEQERDAMREKMAKEIGAAFEAGHWAWPTTHQPTRTVLRDAYVKSRLAGLLSEPPK